MTRKHDHKTQSLTTEKTGFLIVCFAIAVLLAATATGIISTGSDTAHVAVIDNNTVDAVITADTAITRGEKYTGLSNYQHLPNGNGMVFIHNSESEQTYVMRNMDFSIDIVFINNECEVTQIHSAEKPLRNETGEEPKHQYNGTAKYVLEVPHGYTTQRITENDTVNIEYTQCNEFIHNETL